eukprot:1110119-Prymnesium_polylepis.2
MSVGLRLFLPRSFLSRVRASDVPSNGRFATTHTHHTVWRTRRGLETSLSIAAISIASTTVCESSVSNPSHL